MAVKNKKIKKATNKRPSKKSKVFDSAETQEVGMIFDSTKPKNTDGLFVSEPEPQQPAPQQPQQSPQENKPWWKKFFSFNNKFFSILVGLITAGVFCTGMYVLATYGVDEYFPSGNTLNPTNCNPGDTYCKVTVPLSLDQTTPQTISNNSPIFNTLTASKVVFTDASKQLTSTGIGTSSQFIKGDGSLDSSTYLTEETDTLETVTARGATTSTASSFTGGATIGTALTLTAGIDIRPSANSTTAINIAQADGTDFVTFDTTNKRVGIGTTSPSEKLEITGNLRLTSDNNEIKLGAAADASITYDGTNLLVNPREVGSGNTIFSDGNVGIGTTAPLADLHIGGSGKIMVKSGNSLQDRSGDFWMTSNAYYSSGDWQRQNDSRTAFAIDLRGSSNFPGESEQGAALWVAQPGTNPINPVFGSVGGWELGWAITASRNLVVGGMGLELDGNGLSPYGRLVHNNSLSTLNMGIAQNIFADFSGRDVDADPSWFAGFVDDGFKIRRLPGSAAINSGNFASLLALDSSGNLTVKGNNVYLGSSATQLTADNSYLYLNSPDGTTRIHVGSVGVDNRIIFTLQNSDGSAKFQVRDSGANEVSYINSDGGAYFAGNVGIGTTSPGSALDVKGTLRLSGATSGYVGFSPADAAGSTTYTLPSADGSSGYVLSTNGTGTLLWAAPSAGMVYPAAGLAVSTGSAWTTGLAVAGQSGLLKNTAGTLSWDASAYLTAEVDAVVGNEVTNATDSTLTRSGSGTAGSPYTLGLNLGTANAWTALQQFQNASGLEVGKDDATNTAGQIKLWSAGANNYYTTLTAGTQSANATYTLPTAMPASSGYVLSSTDAGVMSWIAPGSSQSPWTGNIAGAGYDLTGAGTISATIKFGVLESGSNFSPIAHYKMNETSGYTVTDAMGSYNGTSANNTSGMTTTAKTGTGALSFNGTTDIITLPAGLSSIGAGDFTFTEWAYKANWSDSHYSWHFGHNSSDGNSIGLYERDAPSRYLAFAVYAGGANANAQIAVSSLSAGWHHFACTYNSTTNIGTLYVDGNSYATFIQDNVTWSGGTNTTYVASGNGYGYFNGNIDDFRIYSIALSPTQVAAIYNSGTGTETSELGSAGTYYTYFQGGDQSGTITYTLPTADGSANTALITNGLGTLSWGTDFGTNTITTTGSGDFGTLTLTNLSSGTGTALLIDGSNNVVKDSSSLRYKTDIEPLADNFLNILQIQPKTFKYIRGGVSSMGYIAEDFEALGLNDLLVYDNQGRPDTIRYDRISVYLAEVAKQQQLAINEIKQRLGMSIEDIVINPAGTIGDGSVVGLSPFSLTETLKTLGMSLVDGVASLTRVVTTTTRTERIEMVATNGDIYCTWIDENGDWQKAKGDCSEVSPQLATASSPEQAVAKKTAIQNLEQKVEQLQQQNKEQSKDIEQAQNTAQQAKESIEQTQEQVQKQVQEVQQQVEQIPQVPTVTAISSISDINVEYNTNINSVNLPTIVQVTLSNSATQDLQTTWDNATPEYSKKTPGTYVFTGTLKLPDNVFNLNNLTATVNVIVGQDPHQEVSEVVQEAVSATAEAVQEAASTTAEVIQEAGASLLNGINKTFKKYSDPERSSRVLDKAGAGLLNTFEAIKRFFQLFVFIK